ncbi:MAG TPA: tetratricopeptide repeat protein [Candidatus Tripitaka californicus]|uniref:tetratricopeptide repeat protein n=1 Tax=Candidatus Tripitaka californicus TaxID=3367616 RepID=UPI004027C3E0|nr:hypothetical protein [Planctomycetota bacterium]
MIRIPLLLVLGVLLLATPIQAERPKPDVPPDVPTDFQVLFPDAPIQTEYTGDAKARFEKGLDCLKTGDPDAAVKELEEATKLQPKVIDGHRYLVIAYSLKLRLQRAVKEYNTIFEINPGLTNVPPTSTLSREENKQTANEFIEGLKKLLKDERRPNPMIHAILAWIYAEKGDLKASYNETLVAIKKLPSLGNDYLDVEAGDDYMGIGESAVSPLMMDLADAMRNNLSLAKQQANVILFSLTQGSISTELP